MFLGTKLFQFASIVLLAKRKPFLKEEQNMNWKPIEGNWPKLVDKALDRWPNLTRDELIKCDGSRDQLKNLLTTKCSFSPQEADDELKFFAENAVGVPTR